MLEVRPSCKVQSPSFYVIRPIVTSCDSPGLGGALVQLAFRNSKPSEGVAPLCKEVIRRVVEGIARHAQLTVISPLHICCNVLACSLH